MKAKYYKTIIVGGGPAGASCGYSLKKAGEDCLIIDAYDFPREKLCGGGLTPKAHILIDNVFDGIKYEYQSVMSLALYEEGKLLREIPLNTEMRVVCRKDFDNVLLEQYLKIGGEKITGRVSAIEENEDQITVTLKSGEKFTCKYLIGADGANSIVRRCCFGDKKNVKTLLLEKTFRGTPPGELKVGFGKKLGKGYYYEFPNPRGYVAGYGSTTTSQEVFDELLVEYGSDSDVKTKGAIIPMYERFEYPFKKNIILIGDAGGYADSMTGEGIYMAVKSGRNAAISITAGKDFKELNASLIKLVKRRNWMLDLFFFPPFYSLFMYILKKGKMSSTIIKRIDRAFSHPY